MSETPVKPEGMPIIIDLGKRSKKRVKELRKGGGKLLDEVREVIEELKRGDVLTGGAETVVVVVREKEKATSYMPFGR